MKQSRRTNTRFGLLCTFILAASCAVSSCAPAADQSNQSMGNANNAAAPAASQTPAIQTLAESERPQKIKDQMAARGQQDEAAPALKIAQPADGATINGATVNVKLNLSGDLKGYKPGKDPATMVNNDPSTMKGNHIHVILDNAPYEAYYDLTKPFELRNVTAGAHTLRVFASRPWHESYKNQTAFDIVTFNVKGGGDASQPTTTAAGERMADNKNAAVNTNAAASAAASPQAAAPEGKDMSSVQGGAPADRKKPLLTYSRPKGEYKGDDANAIMIDFWLSNARLKGDGGEYRVRYAVDGGEAKFLDTWAPIWLTGWTPGKHTVKLELVDRDGNPVENGNFNATSRDITVVK